MGRLSISKVRRARYPKALRRELGPGRGPEFARFASLVRLDRAPGPAGSFPSASQAPRGGVTPLSLSLSSPLLGRSSSTRGNLPHPWGRDEGMGRLCISKVRRALTQDSPPGAGPWTRVGLSQSPTHRLCQLREGFPALVGSVHSFRAGVTHPPSLSIERRLPSIGWECT